MNNLLVSFVITVAIVASLFVSALEKPPRLVSSNRHHHSAPTKLLEWNRTLGTRNIYSSPASTFTTLYIGDNDNGLFAINKKHSNIVWESQAARGPVQSAPTICESCGKGMIYFGSNDHNIYALGLDEGYLQWKFTTNGSVVARPYVHQNVLITGSYDGCVYALSVLSGAQVWKYCAKAPISGAVEVILGKLVFGSWDKKIYCIDARTAEEIWTYEATAEVTASCSYVENTVFCGDNKGTIHAINIMNGKANWTKTLTANEPVQARPCPFVSATSQFLIGVGSGDSNFYALSVSTGDIAWKYAAQGQILASASSHSGRLYFGDTVGNFYALFSNGTQAFKFATPGKAAIYTRPLVENQIFFAAGPAVYCLNPYA